MRKSEDCVGHVGRVLKREGEGGREGARVEENFLL